MEDISNVEIQTPPVQEQRQSFFSRHRKVIWTALIVIALVTASLLTYVLFFRGSNPEPTLLGEVKLKLGVPEEVASGSELNYQLTIENSSNAKLTNLNLEIFYPPGFTFLDSTPDPQSDNPRVFSFPDLPAGREQQLSIVGKLEGGVQEIKTLNGKLHYVPENFRSSFAVEAKGATVIAAPDVTLKIQAPSQSVSGQTITYQIELTNVASKPFSDLLLSVTYPEKFEFNESSPAAPSITNDKGAQWRIGYLGVNEQKTISVSGKLFEEAGKESLVSAELFLKDSEAQAVSAGRTSAFTKISPSPLVLIHRILNLVEPIMPGQILNYEVEYENIGEVGLNNVVISVVFENPVFDFSKLGGGSGQFKNNALVWIPASARELLVVAPRAKGKFKFDIPVSDQLVANLQKNPRVATRVEYYTRELTEPISGNSLDFKVQTQAVVEAIVRVVSGSHPPIAGQPTTYRVELAVQNSVNDIDEAELTAIIPRADVSFSPGSVNPSEEKENVQFVPIAGSFRWQLGKIFAFSGSFHEARKVSFDLTVTPTLSGQTANQPLLRDIQVAGVDDFTQKRILSNKIDTLSP